MSQDDDDSDVCVIEPEDLELAKEIENERKAKRAAMIKAKKEKEGIAEISRKRKQATNRRSDGDDSQSDDDDKPRRRPTRNPTQSGQKKVRIAQLSPSSSEDEIMPKKGTRSRRRRSDIISDSDASMKSDNDDEIEELEADEVEPKSMKKRIGHARIDSDDDDDDRVAPRRNPERRKPKFIPSRSFEEEKKKKKRGILEDEDLAKETVDAEKAERERRKRLEQKQKEFNGIELVEGADLTEALTGQSSQRKLKNVIVDPDAKSVPPVPVAVHQSLVRILKPHQAHGIQFMYDCAIESIERLDTGGSGGILAHCMGLGKTLQVITFLHTVMMHPKTGEHIKRVLVVVPKNVIINWYKEFQKWLYENDEDLDTLEIAELDSCKTIEERKYALKQWHTSKNPSVMIIGYDLFRILTAEEDPKKKKPAKSKSKVARKLAKAQAEFRQYLQNPGPDLVVCDEAHKLKNDESALSRTMVKIRTMRRICLTGTPLQNNLMEYHCMVNFVKPGLLGTKAEFANRFVNIINRGRTKDATLAEVKFMKRRCHVLYEHLKKCVDRKDYRVLTEAIPPKQEYVLNVRLTERQIKLYRLFLETVVNGCGLSKRLLPDYHVLSRIWTHPYLLVLHEKKLERDRLLKEEQDEDEAFLNDDDESEEETDVTDDDTDEELFIASDSDDEKAKLKKMKKMVTTTRPAKSNGADPAVQSLMRSLRASRRLAGDAPEEFDREDTPPEYSGWFAMSGLIEESDSVNWMLSNKLALLCEIIKKCEAIGDKLLVFSQSLESLGLIRRMLEWMAGTGQWFADGHEALNAEGETWSWLDGLDYMTIDGSVQSVKRDAVQSAFNDPDNMRARLMLISTRAGSLGTNMVSANRVVIFDACWNPSHDTQSLFRVYRFGQTKPVYIYRFIAQGTMEERIYKRQVTKESTSMRVVDEAQIQRHYDGHDLEELYQFTPVELDTENEVVPTFAPPKDRLLADVLLENCQSVVDYFEHDTLFANVEDEKLTEEEMRDAWNDYENERRAVSTHRYGIHSDAMRIDANRSITERNSLGVLATDAVFQECMKMPQMDPQIALRIVFLKRALDELLPTIPHEMRGGMNEFSTHFLKLIHESIRTRQLPSALLQKAIDTFRTVIKMVKTIDSCLPFLIRLQAEHPSFFDPNDPIVSV
ncbi:unnamed protein product [Caenorhabditis bovis]|uniref:Uncharacterized protein n=1 Tax=Caenorhabditis bovis TaxID=2654633 RepID=A0A8S1F0D6_9PELO|nr:unnamed protein product [Caenorhabditis bovis]